MVVDLPPQHRREDHRRVTEDYPEDEAEEQRVKLGIVDPPSGMPAEDQREKATHRQSGMTTRFYEQVLQTPEVSEAWKSEPSRLTCLTRPTHLPVPASVYLSDSGSA
jgi:hypothetical protein